MHKWGIECTMFLPQIILHWSFGVHIQHLFYALYETHLVVIVAQVQNDSFRRFSLLIVAVVLVQPVSHLRHQSNGLARMFLVTFFLDPQSLQGYMNIFCILYICFVVTSSVSAPVPRQIIHSSFQSFIRISFLYQLTLLQVETTKEKFLQQKLSIIKCNCTIFSAHC